MGYYIQCLHPEIFVSSVSLVVKIVPSFSNLGAIMIRRYLFDLSVISLHLLSLTESVLHCLAIDDLYCPVSLEIY